MLKWLQQKRRVSSDVASSVSSIEVVSGSEAGGPPWDHAGFVIVKGRRVWAELYGKKLTLSKEREGRACEIVDMRKAVVAEQGKALILSGVGFFSRKFSFEDYEPAGMWLHQFALNGITVKRMGSPSTSESSASSPVQSTPGGNTSFDWVVVDKHQVPTALEDSMLDYRILDPIGSGGFGKVMKVQHKTTGGYYAMKIIRKEHATAVEKAILQSVRHPFIVHLKSVFETKSKLCLVMELLTGGELFHHIRQGKGFPSDRARFYSAELALALSFLHSEGFLYRDLKPENCLLDGEGHVVLADFGLAKKIDPFSSSVTFCGTPAYIAPEVLQGRSATKAVDWWGWGCLLYILLTGAPVFSGTHNTRVYDAILHKEPEYPGHLSPEAVELLKGCLDKDYRTRLSDTTAIKAHPFFEKIDWEDLLMRRVPPPAFDPAPLLLSQVSSKADLLFTEFSEKFCGSPTGDAM